MGTSSDGSSSAAHSAQEENSQTGAPTAPPRKSLMGRLASRFSRGTPVHAPEARTPPSGFRAGLANLRSMRVEDVAVPKAEIIAVPIDIARDDLIDVFRESGFTRLPVFDGTLDHPLGLVHLKDIALQFGFGESDAAPDLNALLRPLIFAPPSMPIGILLGKMQSARMHMALVIDEYGGVDGLVTIEDLIEQVLGEIEDEHDQNEAALFREESPGCWAAAARTPLDEFEAALGMHLADAEDQEDIETLGGLVFMLTGRVPARGEIIRHPAGIDFEVIDADARRIKRLRVRQSGVSASAGRGTTITPTSAAASVSEAARRSAGRARAEGRDVTRDASGAPSPATPPTSRVDAAE